MTYRNHAPARRAGDRRRAGATAEHARRSRIAPDPAGRRSGPVRVHSASIPGCCACRMTRRASSRRAPWPSWASRSLMPGKHVVGGCAGDPLEAEDDEDARSFLRNMRQRLRGRVKDDLRRWVELSAARTEVAILEHARRQRGMNFVELLEEGAACGGVGGAVPGCAGGARERGGGHVLQGARPHRRPGTARGAARWHGGAAVATDGWIRAHRQPAHFRGRNGAHTRTRGGPVRNAAGPPRFAAQGGPSFARTASARSRLARCPNQPPEHE
jgi:hypothetical protein